MPYAMCNTVVGFYLSIFLLEVAIVSDVINKLEPIVIWVFCILTHCIQLDPVYVLIIVFSGRVWDAITDPIVGYLTSLTKTRFGRLRPWLVHVSNLLTCAHHT